MNTEAVKRYCSSLAGANEKTFGEPSNILVFYVKGRKFAYFKTSEPERWRFSIRVTPERFLELTDQPGIKPARYMHRFHWATIVNVAAIDADYLKELIDWSYGRASKTSPRKVRTARGARLVNGSLINERTD